MKMRKVVRKTGLNARAKTIEERWPRCVVPGCDNPVDPVRVAKGHLGCVEEHGDGKEELYIIPLPKSNSVVGRKEELAGVVNSHKTGVVGLSAQSFEHYRNARRAPHVPDIRPVDELLVERMRDAAVKPGGVYLTGDRVLGRAYRLGWTTSASEPARLTPKGLLAREIILRGRSPFHP